MDTNDAQVLMVLVLPDTPLTGDWLDSVWVARV